MKTFWDDQKYQALQELNNEWATHSEVSYSLKARQMPAFSWEHNELYGVTPNTFLSIRKKGSFFRKIFPKFTDTTRNIVMSHELGHAEQRKTLNRQLLREYDPYVSREIFSVDSYKNAIKRMATTLAIEKDAWDRAAENVTRVLGVDPRESSSLWRNIEKASSKSYEMTNNSTSFRKGVAKIAPKAIAKIQTQVSQLESYLSGNISKEQLLKKGWREASFEGWSITPDSVTEMLRSKKSILEERVRGFKELTEWLKSDESLTVDAILQEATNNPRDFLNKLDISEPSTSLQTTSDPAAIRAGKAKQAKKTKQISPPPQQAPTQQAPTQQAQAAAVKEVETIVETVKQSKAAAKVATEATEKVVASEATQAAREGIKKVVQKAKTTLSGAGLAGYGAIGLFTLLALNREQKKSEIAPRRREGRVQEHPRGYSNTRPAAVGASMLGAVAAGLGLLSKRASPTLRATLGIGGAALATMGVSRLYKDDPSVTVLGAAAAGAIATATTVMVNRHSHLGLKALRDFALKHGSTGTMNRTMAAAADVKKLFPGLNDLLSKEGFALGAGLVTFPAAHSIMVRHFAAEKRRTTDHGDSSFIAAWQDNKAGHTGMRKSNAPLFAYNPANQADVVFSGSLNSYYNSASIFGDS